MRCLDFKNFPLLLWILVVHYNIIKSLQLGPNLSQLIPLHTLTPYMFNIYLNFIIPSSRRFPKCYLIFSDFDAMETEDQMGGACRMNVTEQDETLHMNQL
jgi:hypothetical protein